MEYSKAENRILEKVMGLLESFNEQFIKHQITYEIKLKKDKEETGQDYLSELEINFFKEGVFYDIIEFFIFRNGNLYFEEDKLMKNLFVDFEEIVHST